MSDAHDKEGTPATPAGAQGAAPGVTPALDDDDREGDPMRALLKRALSEDAIARDPPDLLRGVQRRIRKRSRGKFFADGWSTAQTRVGYVIVALVTLLLVALAYYALGPMDVR